MNSIYFDKNQKKELHEFIDFIIDYNNSSHFVEKGWGKPFEMKIYNEEEGYIVEFDEPIECEGFQWIDENHYVSPNGSSEFLSIDENMKYCVRIGEDYHNVEIKGDKLLDFIRREHEKE